MDLNLACLPSDIIRSILNVGIEFVDIIKLVCFWLVFQTIVSIGAGILSFPVKNRSE